MAVLIFSMWLYSIFSAVMGVRRGDP